MGRAVVGRQYDEGVVELTEILELLDHPAELLIGDLGRAIDVNLTRSDGAVVAFGVLIGTPHVAGLVDTAERDEHAAHGLARGVSLVLHHRHRGVRHPDVAAEMPGCVGPSGNIRFPSSGYMNDGNAAFVP